MEIKGGWMLAREGTCAPPFFLHAHPCTHWRRGTAASFNLSLSERMCLTILTNTTFDNGSLGFCIDEERRESAKRNVNCRIQ
jgi:hypothetical protein